MSTISPANAHSPAARRAEQALSRAEAAVDADRTAHSPGCVAIDEKRVARAELQVSEASAGPVPGSPGLSITV